MEPIIPEITTKGTAIIGLTLVISVNLDNFNANQLIFIGMTFADKGIEVRDTYLHLPASLKRLAQEFKLPLSKGDYPLKLTSVTHQFKYKALIYRLPALLADERKDQSTLPKYKPIEYLPGGLPNFELFYQMPDRSKKDNEELMKIYKLLNARRQDIIYIAREDRLNYCALDVRLLSQLVTKTMLAEMKVIYDAAYIYYNVNCRPTT